MAFPECAKLYPAKVLGMSTNVGGAAHESNKSGVPVDGQIPGQSYREYIQAQLSSTLTSGTKYFVSFYASLADSCKYSVDDLGAFFSTGQISRTDYDAFNFTPQVQNPQGNYLSNKAVWYRITGTYIAGGTENFITIGNFKNDSSTDTLKISSYAGLNQDYTSAYYYIDYVCVSSDSLLCNSPIGMKQINRTAQNLFYSNNFIYLKNIAVPCTLEIVDLTGRLLTKCEISNAESKIDVASISKGIYIAIIDGYPVKININH